MSSTASVAGGSDAPDIDSFLLPLSDGGSAGHNLRYDPVYRAIAEARREENVRLPQGVWQHDAKRADWLGVERLCGDVLRQRSKDLQVACWLAEAWVQRLDYAGLAPGLRLLTGLCKRFWPDLHPLPDGDDLTSRVGPFEWLNARLPTVIRSLPVAFPEAGQPAYTWTDHLNAQLLEGLRQRDSRSFERSEAAGSVTVAAFQSARARTDPAWWRTMEAALRAAEGALSELNAVLEQKCGRGAPGLGAIAAITADLLSFASSARAETERKVPAIPTRPPAAPPRPTAQESAQASELDARTARDAIYRDLVECAEALQGLEPHSPVPYLIRRAVDWGGLSFAELVLELSRFGLDLGALLGVLGVSEMADAVSGRSPDQENR